MDRYPDLPDLVKDGAFCLSDCNLFESAIRVLREAKKENIPIVLDAGSWKDQTGQYLALADEVIASEDCRPPDSAQLPESADSVKPMDFIAAAGYFGVENIAVTRGERPIIWKDPHTEGVIEPIPVKAKDTLGAGDIFHGAYCFFRYEQNMPFPDSLRRASEVASFSVRYFGPREGIKAYLGKNV